MYPEDPYVDRNRVAHKAIGPGSVVASRFRLEDLLDEDAGARFWRATDLTLVRNVALHVIDADDPRAPAVLTAARTSATVSDGHILRVLDALEEDGLVHVVHEWGSGASLDRMLADSTLEPRHAAWLVREVADAIAVAHRHGVAHGRLLPENVLLTDVGSVKLIGFVVDAVLHGRPRQHGAVAPPTSEHETDVLNLGALLYACLTGRWAGFPDSALPAAPLDHDRVCRPRQVRQGVPRQLDTLCDRIINGDVRTGERHFESAAAISAALGEYLGDTLSGATVAVHEPTVRLHAPPVGTPTEADPGASAPPAPADPEATQPGVPLLAGTASASAAPAEARPDRGPRTGMGVGPAPPAWGPDRLRDSGTLLPVEPEERPGGSWLRLAAVVATVVVLLLAGVVVLSLGRDNGSDTPSARRPSAGGSTSAAPTVLEPAAVRDFDPDQVGGGTPEENPQEVPLATDGKPSTAWTTVRYNDGPALAPYKDGVGLLIDLGADKTVGEVSVTLVGAPYDLQLLAAPKGTSAAPTSLQGLTAIDSRQGASGQVRLAGPQPVTTRYLVVWLTALPPVPGGYRGGIAEVSVRS